MRADLALRLLPLTAAVAAVWFAAHPRWLGLSPGWPPAQLTFGLVGGLLFFVAAAALQLWLTKHVRGRLAVPARKGAASLEATYYLLNAGVEEAFFRGLLQGGLSTLVGAPLGLAAATGLYVLYHRLGRWTWPDVFATAALGVPLAGAFWLLPGPPSLLGVSLAHFGATCGFLGPGPWLLRHLGLLR